MALPSHLEQEVVREVVVQQHRTCPLLPTPLLVMRASEHTRGLMERALHAVVQNSGRDRNYSRHGWTGWAEAQAAVHGAHPLIFEPWKLQVEEVEEHLEVQKRKALAVPPSLVDSLAMLLHRQSRHLHRHSNLGHATSERLCALQMMQCRYRSPHRTLLLRHHCPHRLVVWVQWHHESR